MGLNFSNILDEENLKSGVRKLSQFYYELGFRFTQVNYVIVSESSIAKNIFFTVIKKEKTKLVDIKIENLGHPKVQNIIENYLLKIFRLATLNQENLNKISNKLREQ